MFAVKYGREEILWALIIPNLIFVKRMQIKQGNKISFDDIDKGDNFYEQIYL